MTDAIVVSGLTISPVAIKFYKDILKLLNKYSFPFMIGGGISVTKQSDVDRPVKDLDIFVKAGDYPKILSMLKDQGFKTAIQDERWVAKASKGKFQVDFIFSSPNYLNSVDDSWFKHAKEGEIFGLKVKMVSPEEIVWCKAYVQDRNWYDGADINHMILSQGSHINWKHLLGRFENHWEILFGILLNFRFVYPSERGTIPKWLLEELISRLQSQLKNPIPKDKVCRGPLLSRYQYQVDIQNGYQIIT
jgi:hypothetical protein